MNKNTFFVIVIIGLLISNILMFFYIGFVKKNNNSVHAGPRDIVIEKLALSPEQIKIYDELIVVHRREVRIKNQEIIRIKSELYSTYLMKENETAKDSLIQEIVNTQKEIEQTHFNHFKDIKNICRKDQQRKCEAFFEEITHIFPQTQLPKK